MSVALLCSLSGCRTSEPTTSTNPSPTISTPVSQIEEAAANISEIQQQPVLVRQLNATEEITATEGMALQFSETIRTKGEALAQVDLKNGLAFRIGGDAVLTLQPDNRLNLSAGEMITWVEPGKQVPIEIVTPGAIAGIRGTTVFVKIPKDPNQEIEIFSWEGCVEVWLPNQPGEVIINAGERVKIRRGETDISRIRASVERLKPRQWLQRRRRSRLLNNFRRQMPTIEEIDNALPPEVKTITPPA
ncbi:MAG: FecR domain-containing protein [Xenococcaceae cyanobacterium]